MEKPTDLYNTPSLEPPKGVEPNLVDPYSYKAVQIAPVFLCVIVSTIAVLVRLYAKAWIVRRVTIDDYFLIFAALSNFPQGVLYILNGFHGNGSHQWNVRLSNLELILEYSNYIEILWCLGMMSVKYTVLVTIQNIFNITRAKGGKGNAKYWLLQVLIWSNFAFYIAITLATIFQCLPRRAIWDPFVEGATCLNVNALLIATPCLNLISDALMLIIPFSEIKKLRLPTARKLKIGAVFGVAILTIINCALRIGFTVVVSKSEDFTWTIPPVTFLACTEYMFAILCACLPLFPRVYKHVRRSRGLNSMPTPPETRRVAATQHQANPQRPSPHGSQTLHGSDDDMKKEKTPYDMYDTSLNSNKKDTAVDTGYPTLTDNGDWDQETAVKK